ncbi:MAG: dTDP-4-dehydrorhamnose reductase [Prevotellaceae bacterium]|nr:dTDP-4-dehydrorhamnose reductase [Prevotellaceae bacterium]
MNVLVTGAGGQLGNEMQLVAKHSRDSYIFTDVVPPYLQLDITDERAVKEAVEQWRIDCIVNCAAYTDVDRAETDGQLLSERLNALAVENLAKAMSEREGLLVHISTDYVFGLEPYNTPCQETRQGTPTGVYGRTKLEGEQAILRSGVEHLILRTAWLYSEFGRNFLKTMLRLTKEKEEVRVVFDQCGTPTYALDLARAILFILDGRLYKGHCGTYNYSNEGVCSWYDFAHAIARMAGNTECRVLPCHSSEYPSPVRRPSYSVLDKTLIKETFGLEIPHWTESLGRCIDNLLKEQHR